MATPIARRCDGRTAAPVIRPAPEIDPGGGPGARMTTCRGDGRPGPMTTGGTAGRRRRQRPMGEDLAAGMDGTPPDDGSRREDGRGWKDRGGVPAADGWRPPPRPKG